jgi:hypothetical protein
MNEIPFKILLSNYVKFKLEQIGLPWETYPVDFIITDFNLQNSIRCITDHFQQYMIEIPTILLSNITSINMIIPEFFNDGIINWGKIIIIFIITATYCIHVKTSNLIDQIIKQVNKFVEIHLSYWIQENGGWTNMIKKIEKKEIFVEFKYFIYISFIISLFIINSILSDRLIR